MHIASLVVYSLPGQTDAVVQHLGAFPGVEIHAAEQGRLVVTVEAGSGRSMGEAVVGLHNIDGVLSAAMVFHYCDEPSAHSTNNKEVSYEAVEA